jgi:hypothetical protein
MKSFKMFFLFCLLFFLLLLGHLDVDDPFMAGRKGMSTSEIGFPPAEPRALDFGENFPANDLFGNLYFAVAEETLRVLRKRWKGRVGRRGRKGKGGRRGKRRRVEGGKRKSEGGKGKGWREGGAGRREGGEKREEGDLDKLALLGGINAGESDPNQRKQIKKFSHGILVWHA